MADSVFDRETLLDISVNIIPLFIIAFFVVMLLVGSAWPPDPFVVVISLMLHVIPFVLLALLTYVAAHYI
ncbi:DUF6684 family protein [Halorussus amylolyticus]|uniref:DUF6684 family protein n=1 Tax=Halorussus amylolyticus TaxID=1126242 RepID=UPI001048040E|nr:DUF6684 family protein [Halorussus amylolyticus]